MEGRRFPIHKAVLAARSPYFAAMFGGDFREGQSDAPTVSVSWTSVKIVEAALSWCYIDVLQRPHNVEDSALLAHLLEVCALKRTLAGKPRTWDVVSLLWRRGWVVRKLKGLRDPLMLIGTASHVGGCWWAA